MKKTLFIILTIALVYSCSPIDDYNKGYIIEQDTELGDVLILMREDTSFYRYVGSNNEKRILQKGAVIQYHNSSGEIDTVKTWGGASVISSHVNRKGLSDVFILIEQKPLDSIFGKTVLVKNKSGYRPNMPSTIADAKQMLMDSDVKKYWIINKLTDDIYGPLEQEEYLRMKKELKVPDSIILKFPR